MKILSFCHALALTAAGLASTSMALDVDPVRFRNPASFQITDKVINEDVEPFTATIGSFGNALHTASFEPAHFRTRFFAQADAPDRVVLDKTNMTSWDSLRDGFFEDAEVMVYRIMDGKMRIVRKDRVAKGGSKMADWNRATPDGKLVPNAGGGVSGCRFPFDAWNRTDVPYWFAVSAVDKSGAESPKSGAVSVLRTADKPSSKPVPAEWLSFNAPGTGQASVKAPAGLKGSYDPTTGEAVLEWTASASANIAGYRVYVSDFPPEQHTDAFFLKLAGGAPSNPEANIRKGDWVVLCKKFMSYSRNQYVSNRVWGSHQNKVAMPDGMPVFPDENPALSWELEAYGADAPVAEGGQTCAKFTMKEGAKLLFENYNHGPTKQSWYPVLQPGETYIVEFWARQKDMAAPTASFKLNGFYRDLPEQKFEIGSSWQKFRGSFTIDKLYEGEGGIGQTSLVFQGPGILWLDNFRIYNSAAAFLDYMPGEYANLKKSGMMSLRTHAFIKTATHAHTMEQLTNPAGSISGINIGNTLPQTLGMMEQAGVLPWLQVEMYMTPDEWLGFVEYMAAPYDTLKDTPASKPWAYKRHSQGHARPWTDAFRRIDFEISNETWNWLFNPWVFEEMTDGKTGRVYNRCEVYGIFQEHVIDCLKASPYWKAAGLDEKVRFVLGGWRVQDYGLKAATTSPRSHLVTRAGYNGGWDEGEGPSEGNDASLFMTTIHPGHVALPEAVEMKAKRDKMRQDGIADFGLGTYEAGPGYALSGLNNQARMTEEQVRAQEETMKSLAAGTATLDTFLGRAANDYDIQNFFTFYHGRSHWVSHVSLQKGGWAHPCWMTLELFNNVATGDMLNVETRAVPMIDLPAHKRRKALADVPLVSCYATRKQDRLCVFVLSRKIDNYPLAGDDGFTPVSVELPIQKAKSVTLFRMVGDPRSHNLDSEQVKIERLALNPAMAGSPLVVNDKTGADARGLPPGATLLYVFDGISK